MTSGLPTDSKTLASDALQVIEAQHAYLRACVRMRDLPFLESSTKNLANLIKSQEKLIDSVEKMRVEGKRILPFIEKAYAKANMELEMDRIDEKRYREDIQNIEKIIDQYNQYAKTFSLPLLSTKTAHKYEFNAIAFQLKDLVANKVLSKLPNETSAQQLRKALLQLPFNAELTDICERDLANYYQALRDGDLESTYQTKDTSYVEFVDVFHRMGLDLVKLIESFKINA